MKRTLIKKLNKEKEQKVKVAGWVNTIRNQGSIKFLLLRDVSGTIQIVISDSKKLMTVVESLSLESVIEVVGKLKKEKQAPDGIEIAAEDINILAKSLAPLPIAVVEKEGKEPSQSKRIDWRWIDLRKPEKQLIFKVWTEFERGLRTYFENNEYFQIYTPSFMSTPSESGSELFTVKYFDRKAYLAQSPQFYKQMAMAAGFERIFCFGPVYRAEPSFTTRHTTEFTGCDVEVSYIESHYDVAKIEEELLVSAFSHIKKKLGLDICVPTIPFPKISMEQAKKKLISHGIKGEKEYDLSPEEEREICKIIKKETSHDFVFITEYPVKARPFYHMRLENDSSLTKSYDLLYRGVEITTGAQREHSYDKLVKQAKEKGMNLKSLNHYLNFFKYGCPPHGGFGIGPSRIIAKMLGIDSIKEVTFAPRDVKRLTP